MDSRELRDLQEAYNRVYDEAYVPWDKPKPNAPSPRDQAARRQVQHSSSGTPSGQVRSKQISNVRTNMRQGINQTAAKTATDPRREGTAPLTQRHIRAAATVGGTAGGKLFATPSGGPKPSGVPSNRIPSSQQLRSANQAAQSRRGPKGGGSTAQGVGSPSGTTGRFQVGGGQGYGISGIKLANSFDPFDIVIGHLLDEGYADTEQAALKIMVNMSEEWRENIIEAEVLAKKGGVEGVGSGANWKAKSWTGAEKSRYSSYQKPTAPAANSSENAPKASGSAPARPQTTKSDVDLYKLQSRDDRRDFERQAMAARKSPVEYQRKLKQDADSKADAPQDTAATRQGMYQQAKGDAEEIGSWYKYNPNDPKDKAEVKKLAMKNYNRKLAILQNRKDFDPSKYDTDDFQPKQRTGRQAWDAI